MAARWSIALVLGAAACADGSAQTTGSLTSGGTAGRTDAGDRTIDAAIAAGGSANGSATIPGTTLPLPASCAELGMEISFGCDNCPTEPPHCDCLVLGSALLLPEQSCIWGKCLVDYDCERLCLNNIETMTQLFGEDALASNQCVAAMSACTEDAECGRGRCRDVTASEPGQCFGAYYEPCETDADCMLGLNCVRNPEGRCMPAARGGCNEDAHCEAGSRCVIYRTETLPSGEDIDIGGCSTGEVSEICTQPEHCVAPLECVTLRDEPNGECSEAP